MTKETKKRVKRVIVAGLALVACVFIVKKAEEKIALRKMIVAGNYEHVDFSLYKYPLNTYRKLYGDEKSLTGDEVRLIPVDSSMLRPNLFIASKKLEERGFRSAKLPELLTYMSRNPDLPQNLMIAALGSYEHPSPGPLGIYDENTYPCILVEDGARSLIMNDSDNMKYYIYCEINKPFYFAVVSK